LTGAPGKPASRRETLRRADGGEQHDGGGEPRTAQECHQAASGIRTPGA